MAEHIILCGYLGICSCYDCRYRRIPLWLLRLGIGMGFLYAAVMLLTGRIVWQMALAGAAPGTVMLLYSRLSQEKLGWADGLMVLVACFFTFLAALLLLLSGKGSKSTKIPFAPFFLAAVLILGMMDMVLGNGGKL